MSKQEDNGLVVGNPDCRFSNVVFSILNDDSAEVSAKFPLVASSLGVSDLEVETLKHALRADTLSIMDVYGKILMEWKMKEGNEATLAKLIRVLETHKLLKTADSLRAKFRV